MEGAVKLADRDVQLIVDKSGSMDTEDCNGKSRWVACQEAVLSLARKIDKVDKDGMVLYAFNDDFKRHEGVTSAHVANLFGEHEPGGSTNLKKVLDHALNDYFQRRSAGKTKPNGELIIVVTDGEPSNTYAEVEKTIIDATKKLDKDEELAISFLQIGSDTKATKFLKTLDDDLVSKGAKFDIVDVKTVEELGGLTFAQFVDAAFND